MLLLYVFLGCEENLICGNITPSLPSIRLSAEFFTTVNQQSSASRRRGSQSSVVIFTVFFFPFSPFPSVPSTRLGYLLYTTSSSHTIVIKHQTFFFFFLQILLVSFRTHEELISKTKKHDGHIFFGGGGGGLLINGWVVSLCKTSVELHSFKRSVGVSRRENFSQIFTLDLYLPACLPAYLIPSHIYPFMIHQRPMRSPSYRYQHR